MSMPEWRWLMNFLINIRCRCRRPRHVEAAVATALLKAAVATALLQAAVATALYMPMTSNR